ncbi:MAG TPA: acyl-CoA carboxylase subunit epsilon [Tessaracoccus flavescens]|uniref:Acyl-CoA carboxylase subunit epsilon n=1 Tax=Tessaracoccus flavescens TaxID=399497 RepID=A0A921JQY3_9ACTN|nr:acyl-CoA carboxylase subunit epsilon [Tessaracoccus flavescens]
MTDGVKIPNKAKLTEEEVAAVAAVLAAAARTGTLRSADDRPLAGGWKSYYRTVRSPLVGGRDAWRTYNRM